jgi:hypothetical protein
VENIGFEQFHNNCVKYYTLYVPYATHTCLKAICTADVQLKLHSIFKSALPNNLVKRDM